MTHFLPNLMAELGRVSPETIPAVRKQLHWAAQVPGAVGNSFLESQEDDTHTTLEWLPSLQLFATRALGVHYRVGLRFLDASLVLLDEKLKEISTFPLHGKTLPSAYDWAGNSISSFLQQPLDKPIEGRDYDIPEHPVQHGEAFDFSDLEACQELGRWFSAAAQLLEGVSEQLEGTSMVRCWPHHFDIAVLQTLDPEKDSESARSINLGLSPGDGDYQQPYWYVGPWPKPEPSSLSEIPGGHWHTDGWVSAVMEAKELLAITQEKDLQAEAIRDFYQSSWSMAKKVLSAE